MVMVKVRVFASLREDLGWREKDYNLPVEDLRGFIEALKEKGDLLHESLFDEEKGGIAPIYKVFLNGRDTDSLEKLETKLRDHDTIAILPPVGGG